MWVLIVAVITVVNGEVREERLRAQRQFDTLQECLTHGHEAAGDLKALPDVRGVGFVCAPAPQV